jgi:hypothetical protein
MVERQLPKLHTRVRFPSPAPTLTENGRADLLVGFAALVLLWPSISEFWPCLKHCDNVIGEWSYRRIPLHARVSATSRIVKLALWNSSPPFPKDSDGAA